MSIKVGAANTHWVIYMLVSYVPAHLWIKKSNFNILWVCCCKLASFPGLSCFYLLFAFTIIHRSGRPFNFCRSSDSVYYCERKREIKTNRGGLGPRLAVNLNFNKIWVMWHKVQILLEPPTHIIVQSVVPGEHTTILLVNSLLLQTGSQQPSERITDSNSSSTPCNW